MRALGAGWDFLCRLTNGAVSFLLAGDLILKVRARRRRRGQLLACMGSHAASEPLDDRNHEQLAAQVREIEEEIAALEAEIQYARSLFHRRT